MIKFILQCDICGAEGLAQKPGDVGWHPTIKIALQQGSVPPDEQFDLCNDCGRDLIQFIKEGPGRRQARLKEKKQLSQNVH